MNKQVPLWSLLVASGIAILFLCGITGAVAGKPKPETVTETVYKTKTVKDDSQTKEIAELKVELETCQRSTLLASQAFVDMTNAFVKLSEGASNLDVTQVNEASAMIENIDSGAVGAQARECDDSIASKITGLPS